MFRGLGKKLYSWACGQDYFSGQAYAYNYKLPENKKKADLVCQPYSLPSSPCWT